MGFKHVSFVAFLKSRFSEIVSGFVPDKKCVFQLFVVLRPSVLLGFFGQQCCVRLHGPLKPMQTDATGHNIVRPNDCQHCWRKVVIWPQ